MGAAKRETKRGSDVMNGKKRGTVETGKKK